MTTQDTTRMRAQFGLALIATAGLCAGLAQATPEGGDVVSGSATIDTVGSNTTITTGHSTIINWTSFDIGSGESVQFIMPGASSRVLNRVNSVNATMINGSLSANGQVYIVNPSGIVFGQGAVVNAGAIHAAAGNISNADFTAGVDRFTGVTGNVTNMGRINAQLVTLIGASVGNIGTIDASDGTVIMASGEQVMIGEHLGHRFVQVEVPADLSNMQPVDGSPRLAAGDVYSIAAWNTGSINGRDVTIATSGADVMNAGRINATGEVNMSGDRVIATRMNDALELGGAPITAASVTLTGSTIDLGADVTATGGDITLAGNTRLIDNVSLNSTSGAVDFFGNVFSESGMYYGLDADAALNVNFIGSIGDNPTSDMRLGSIHIDSIGGTIRGNVSTLGDMVFLGDFGLAGPSVTFHVGEGTALFGGNLFAVVRGTTDVAFMYDGDPFAGLNEGRTPFKFQGSLGVGRVFGPTMLSGSFRNITFGDDRSSAIDVASFLFADGANEGLALTDLGGFDSSDRFFVSATEGVTMGEGQRLLSFGSLDIGAKNRSGVARLELGDLSVLGNLRITATGTGGSEIVFHERLAGEVDRRENEFDRPTDVFMDLGTDIIATGSIDLIGTVVGTPNVIFATGSGTANNGGLPVVTYTEDPTIAYFAAASGMGAYAYDLAVGEHIDPVGPTGTTANLAEALLDEDTIQIRDNDPYLASRQVLIELGLQPDIANDDLVRSAAKDGVTRYAADPTNPSLPLERLSPRSVDRLVDSYVGLLGAYDAQSETRTRIDEVRDALRGSDEERAMAADRINEVLDRIDLLELTPLERNRAKANFLTRVLPNSVDPQSIGIKLASN